MRFTQLGGLIRYEMLLQWRQRMLTGITLSLIALPLVMYGLFGQTNAAEVQRTWITAGGIATPADAALCMQLGADGVFVGSGIFKSEDPSTRAKAIVEATTHFEDPEILARVSGGLGDAMSGLSAAALAPDELLETRGW